MKKIILMSLVASTLCFSAKAYKEVTTTITVKGTAKDVTTNTNTGTVTVNCEQSIWDCYTQTTTVIVNESQVVTPAPGDNTEIRITDNNGVRYHIKGGIIRETGGVLSDGTIQHSFEFSNLQVTNE